MNALARGVATVPAATLLLFGAAGPAPAARPVPGAYYVGTTAQGAPVQVRASPAGRTLASYVVAAQSKPCRREIDPVEDAFSFSTYTRGRSAGIRVDPGGAFSDAFTQALRPEDAIPEVPEGVLAVALKGRFGAGGELRGTYRRQKRFSDHQDCPAVVTSFAARRVLRPVPRRRFAAFAGTVPGRTAVHVGFDGRGDVRSYRITYPTPICTHGHRLGSATRELRFTRGPGDRALQVYADGSFVDVGRADVTNRGGTEFGSQTYRVTGRLDADGRLLRGRLEEQTRFTGGSLCRRTRVSFLARPTG